MATLKNIDLHTLQERITWHMTFVSVKLFEKLELCYRRSIGHAHSHTHSRSHSQADCVAALSWGSGGVQGRTPWRGSQAHTPHGKQTSGLGVQESGEVCQEVRVLVTSGNNHEIRCNGVREEQGLRGNQRWPPELDSPLF